MLMIQRPSAPFIICAVYESNVRPVSTYHVRPPNLLTHEALHLFIKRGTVPLHSLGHVLLPLDSPVSAEYGADLTAGRMGDSLEET